MGIPKLPQVRYEASDGFFAMSFGFLLAHVEYVEEILKTMKKLAAIGALGLLASCLFAQGLNTT